MTAYLYTNFAEGRLVLDMPEDGLLATIGVTESSTFPHPLTGSQAFRVTVFDGTQAPEIMECVGNDATGELFVDRAKEGTVAKRWPAGSLLRLAPTAEQFQKLITDASTVPVYSENVTFAGGIYTIVVPSIYFDYTVGRRITFLVPAGGTNTGACSARLSDGTSFLPSEPIKSATGGAPEAGELVAGNIVELVLTHGGTQWQFFTLTAFQQSGSGAVQRSLGIKARDFVTAEDYGAVGDGVADDLQAIKDALTAKSHVQLLNKTYRISGTLELKPGQTLMGCGGSTQLIGRVEALSAASPPIYGDFDLVKISGGNSTLRDLTLVGGNNGIRLIGELGPNAYNEIENISLWDVQTGILMDGGLSLDWVCQFNWIHEIVVYRPENAGFLSTVTGAGNAPTGNKISRMKVDARGYAMTGPSKCGFDLQSMRRGNSFVDCAASLFSDAVAGLRVASGAFDTDVVNFEFDCQFSTPALRIEGASTGTSIFNLRNYGVGEDIDDVTGSRNYLAVNSGEDSNFFPDAYIKQAKIDGLVLGGTVDLNNGSAIIPSLAASVHLVNAGTLDATVLLPKAVESRGLLFFFKKVDASTFTVTLQENGGPGPDGADYVITRQNGSVTVWCDGNNWRVLQKTEEHTSILTVTAGGIFVPDMLRNGYFVDCTAGTVTCQLPSPSAATVNKRFFIKRVDGSGNQVLVTANVGTGPDARVWTLDNIYDWVEVISDGANWWLVGSNIQPLRAKLITAAGVFNATGLQETYLVDCTLGNITINPPAASAALNGREILIKRIDASANTVTVGGTYDGLSISLGVQYDHILLRCASATWYIVSGKPRRLKSKIYGTTGVLIPTLLEEVCLVNASTGAVTFQLPTVTAVMEGIELVVKKNEASANVVTVTALTGTGPDAATFALATINKMVRVGVIQGAWRVLGIGA